MWKETTRKTRNRWVNNIDLKWGGVDWTDLTGQGLMEALYEHNNELSVL
jgi:hypothetical protein